MQDRLTRFISEIKDGNLVAALVTKPENMRYLSGYTGEGALLISGEIATIITDFRYVEQAEQEAPGIPVEQTTADVKADQVIARCLMRDGIDCLALETDRVSYDQYMHFSDTLKGVSLCPLKSLAEKLRVRKDQGEIEAISEAAAIACMAFDDILAFIKPGMTEREIKLQLEYTMLKRGAEAIAFSTIACAGPNGSLPHATPSDRPVQKGELLTLDFGAQVRGYKSDITRTIAIGKPDAELLAIYETVFEAQMLALQAVRPGASCAAVDKIARDYIDARYPGAFGHGLGHGVGLEIHESPRLSKVSEDVLLPGHVITVEPGVYLPGVGGCRIEDTVAVTEDGFHNFMTARKELIII